MNRCSVSWLIVIPLGLLSPLGIQGEEPGKFTDLGLTHQQIIVQRKAAIYQLVGEVERYGRRRSDYHQAAAAMETLGAIRATEGIHVLVRHIGYPKTAEIADELLYHSAARISVGGNFPAVRALRQIGQPSVKPVIEKLGTTESDMERTACIELLRQLQTPREDLERAAAASTGQRRESLMLGLELYDDWLPQEERIRILREKMEQYLERQGAAD